MATIDARFIDRTTEDESVITVRVRAKDLTAAQIDAHLAVAYPYPTYFRLDREPTLALAFPAVTAG